ncbi:MAG: hypothetical protein N3E50_04700 [Candidatus Goldbacteria bacterium]|nr:hypothetical protein [Candidatus Goldiibacteriota bacterium]
MYDENELIKILTDAKIENIKIDKNRENIKSVLLKLAYYKKEEKSKNIFKIPLIYKYITAVAGFFALIFITFFVIDNMDDGDRFNRNGGIWSTYSDRHQGGDSVVWPTEYGYGRDGFIMSSPGYGNKGWAVRVTGRTGYKLGYNYNYLGVVVRFNSKSYCPECKGTNIRKYNGIRFKIKGNLQQGQLFFILPYESENCISERLTCESLTDYADYEKDISNYVKEDWQTVMIDFRKDLSQPFWVKKDKIVDIEKVLESVHLFKWQYKNGNGEIMEIWIDDVELY